VVACGCIASALDDDIQTLFCNDTYVLGVHLLLDSTTTNSHVAHEFCFVAVNLFFLAIVSSDNTTNYHEAHEFYLVAAFVFVAVNLFFLTLVSSDNSATNCEAHEFYQYHHHVDYTVYRLGSSQVASTSC